MGMECCERPFSLKGNDNKSYCLRTSVIEHVFMDLFPLPAECSYLGGRAENDKQSAGIYTQMPFEAHPCVSA